MVLQPIRMSDADCTSLPGKVQMMVMNVLTVMDTNLARSQVVLNQLIAKGAGKTMEIASMWEIITRIFDAKSTKLQPQQRFMDLRARMETTTSRARRQVACSLMTALVLGERMVIALMRPALIKIRDAEITKSHQLQHTMEKVVLTPMMPNSVFLSDACSLLIAQVPGQDTDSANIRVIT